MRDVEQAQALAQMLVGISEQFGRKARAIVSDMNEPLGQCIGTGIEVVEARDMLRGGAGDERARSGCLQIAAAMLELGGVAERASASSARPRRRKRLREVRRDGRSAGRESRAL